MRAILIIALFAATNPANAVTIDGEGIDKTSMFLNNTKEENWVAKQNSAQVRIPITIVPFEKVEVRRTNSKVESKSVPMEPIHKTLRARIDRANQFYLDGYRVETTPLKWSRAEMMYKVKLEFFKLYGENNELDEKIGQIIMDGQLIGKDKLFVLHGAAKITIQDKESEKSAEIIAGYSGEKPSAPVAKAAAEKSSKL